MVSGNGSGDIGFNSPTLPEPDPTTCLLATRAFTYPSATRSTAFDYLHGCIQIFVCSNFCVVGSVQPLVLVVNTRILFHK
jgi:hypothetical protein